MKEGSRITRSATCRAAAVLLLAIVLVYFPALFLGKTIFPADEFLMTYKPFSAAYPTYAPFNHFDDDILKGVYLYQQVARDHLYHPGWVSGIFGGIPLYANTYASHFSTLNWILPLGPLFYTYPLRLMAFQWIAGISMFLFTTYLGASFFPALISGLAYLFSSLFITMLLRWWIPSAFAWVPLLLLFTLLHLRQGKGWAAAAAAMVLAFSFLDGFFQTSVSILLAWALFSLAAGESWKGWRPSLRVLLFCAGVFVVAFLLSAVMWFPQLEYFWGDLSKGSSRASGNVFGKNLLERLISLVFLPLGAFFPQALGSVRTMDLTKLARTHLQDFSLFLGTIPLLAGLAAFSLKRDPVRRALSLLGLIGLIVPALTFLDRYLYFRFLAVYLVAIAALAGLGLEEARPEDRKIKTLANFGFAFWILLALPALGLRFVLWAKPGLLEEKMKAYLSVHFSQSAIGLRNPAWMMARGEAFLRYWSFQSWEFNFAYLLVGVSLLLWLLWARAKISRNSFFFGAFFTVLAQSWLTVHLWFPFSDLKEFPLFPANEVSGFFQREDPKQEYRANVDDFVGGIQQSQIVPANSNLFFRFSTLYGQDGVRPFTAWDLSRPGLDGLREMNVKFLLTHPAPLLHEPGLLLRQNGKIAIYELENAASRGRLTASYIVGPENSARAWRAGRKAGENSVYLERQPGFPSSEAAPKGQVKLLRDEGNRVVYSVSAERPVLFVATETFYPGWRAFWRGEEREVWRADGGLRAVELSPGEGQLEFRFEPRSFFYGMLVSAIAFSGWLLWLGSVCGITMGDCVVRK